jgi:hypothetical protein
MTDRQKPETCITQKKGITFNNRVSVRRTIHISNFTDEEINACWYSSEDYSAIRKHIHKTVLLMQYGNTSHVEDCPTFCRRGLEGYTSEGLEGRRRRCTNAKLAVFDEQDRQYDAFEESDDNKIGKVYQKRCRSSRDIATTVGLVDERVALDESVPPALLSNLFSVTSTAQRFKIKSEITVNAKDTMSTTLPSTTVLPQAVQTRMMPSAA